MFDQFTGGGRPRERRRLLASFRAATAVYAVLGGALAFVLGRSVVQKAAEEPVDVTFYKAPPPPPPPPSAPPPPAAAPAPPPPPPPPRPSPKPPVPRVNPPKPFEAPASVPQEQPKEADPSQETGPPDTPPGGGDPAGLPGGKDGGKAGGTPGADGTGPVTSQAPIILPAGATKPERLDPGSQPDYPASAREARIEGEVIVKVVVKVDGSVELVKVIKSNPPFDEAVRAFLPKMRYRPAVYNGQPIAVYQNIRFPFTLR